MPHKAKKPIKHPHYVLRFKHDWRKGFIIGFWGEASSTTALRVAWTGRVSGAWRTTKRDVAEGMVGMIFTLTGVEVQLEIFHFSGKKNSPPLSLPPQSAPQPMALPF